MIQTEFKLSITWEMIVNTNCDKLGISSKCMAKNIAKCIANSINNSITNSITNNITNSITKYVAYFYMCEHA